MRRLLVLTALVVVLLASGCSRVNPTVQAPTATPAATALAPTAQPATPAGGDSATTATPTVPAPTNTPLPAPPSPLAAVSDPKDGSYLVDGQTITLAGGKATTEVAPGSASKVVTRYFGNAVQMDLNGDGTLDAAFLLTQEGGGSGTFFYVTAALRTPAGYIGTNAIFLGDRIAPQNTEKDPANAKQFIVNFAERKPGEPMSAQPSVGVSRWFRVEDGTLVEVTPPAP